MYFVKNDYVRMNAIYIEVGPDEVNLYHKLVIWLHILDVTITFPCLLNIAVIKTKF